MGQLHPCQCRSHPGDDQSFRSLAHNGRRQWPSVMSVPAWRPSLEVADIVRAYASAYRARHPAGQVVKP